tara:strand:- start:291 stop:455 length:165 start_codon:yes stop_codon:yes gene_type:complete
MSNRDARSRAFDERLLSERKKWEFRYDNQDKRIKALEDTVRELRKKIKELKNNG